MERIGVIRCLAAAVLFGATAPAASLLAGTIPTLTLAGMLYLGAALAVLPFVVRRPPSSTALRAEWRPVLVAVVVGGAVGPALLVAGLSRADAATASILLNTELVATVVLATVFFHEHLGPKLLVGASLITIAGVVLVWEPGVGFDVGALLIVGACACWGLDNVVTANIEHLSPEHVVALKGTIAGGTNLALGLAIAGLGAATGGIDVLAALAIGAIGYGVSITLWVKGARDLGAARGQVIFATAPFIGAGIAWTILDEPISAIEVAATVLAAAGVTLAARSAHEHRHHHRSIDHEHEHTHDDGHHRHDHDDIDSYEERRGHERHTHVHRHEELTHIHPHVPDLHHRHDH